MARNLLFPSCAEFKWIAATDGRRRSHRTTVPRADEGQGWPHPLAIALLRDAQGSIELRQLRPDKALIKRAAGDRPPNGGKPIRDPVTREIIGYEDRADHARPRPEAAHHAARGLNLQTPLNPH
jgi:hypothetical protein